MQPEKNFYYTAGRYYRATMTEGRGAYFYQIYDLKILYESEYLSGEGFQAGLCILMIFMKTFKCRKLFRRYTSTRPDRQ